MAKKKSRLGKGLGALLGDVKATTQIAEQGSSLTPVNSEQIPSRNSSAQQTSNKTSVKPDGTAVPSGKYGYKELPIEALKRGEYQPRVRMDKDALAELSESIKSQGIVQPLLVRPLSHVEFEIIAGERRWRAAQLAGLKTVPVVVREINDQTAMAVGLIENIQREDLNAIEEARGYQRLLDEFGLTHQEVSEAVGCSRTAVSNLLRLLMLHPTVQTMLEEGQLDMGHARALLGLEQNMQPRTANTVIKKKMSVRQTEQLVRSLNKPKGENVASSGNNADVNRLVDDLSQRIGAKVDIQHGTKKGKLIIHYHSLDELDGILERIK